MSVATATTWITNFIISLIYPQLIALLGTAIVFFVFALTNGFVSCYPLYLLMVVNEKAYENAEV